MSNDWYFTPHDVTITTTLFSLLHCCLMANSIKDATYLKLLLNSDTIKPLIGCLKLNDFRAFVGIHSEDFKRDVCCKTCIEMQVTQDF